MEIIYCRGGDRYAPELADAAGMRYGIRYDYTAYADVFMVDAGLRPRWRHYMKRLSKLRPNFAMTADYETPQKQMLAVSVISVGRYANRVGVCPKFPGAVFDIPEECVICESIPSEYAGWLIPDDELIPARNYHLLGGDPVLQKKECIRIANAGGRVVSVDGNKLAMKAAHGQVFAAGRWLKHSGATNELARISAFEIVEYLNGDRL